MTELPPDCKLPVGVEWCGEEDGTAFFLVRRPSSEHFVNGSPFEIVLIGVAWEDLFPDERKDKSARCAMWWDDQQMKIAEDDSPCESDFANAIRAKYAWRQLWCELEGVK